MGSRPADLAVLVPVLRRPQNVRPLLESIKATTPEPYRVVFVCDPDDRAERQAVSAEGGESFLVSGNYARKIAAGVRGTSESLLFLAADDLEPQAGWFEAAESELRNGVQVVGVNDLCNPRTMRGEHATHFLVTREYAERPTIDGEQGPLCQRYAHNCVDDELIATARHRGVYAFAEASHVRHDHPMAGRAEMDDTYRKGAATLRRDRLVFRRRSRLWKA